LAASSVLRFSKPRLLQQVALWRQHLPTVTPFYAVKSNNDPQVLRWLKAGGVRFDCASPREMREVIRAGATPSDILYAHPTKSDRDIRAAQRIGATTTVVDSTEEVVKLAATGWRGNALIRLLVPDAGSAQPFSRKFGAPLDWVPEILYTLRSAKIPHVGWSFHVGSECNKPDQFRTAIEVAAAAGSAKIVDVGGGFVPDPERFAAAANEITRAMHLFPPETAWIGEPGRFFSAPVAELEVEIIAVKPRIDPDGSRNGWRYTVDETIYGTFSNIPFDGQRPNYRLLSPDADNRPRVRATLFGRTCDSADCLAEDIELPELHVGDRLSIQNMGAYTIVSASEFNGFPSPKRVYDPTPRQTKSRTPK
jgi:ornithine decarboxylase